MEEIELGSIRLEVNVAPLLKEIAEAKALLNYAPSLLAHRYGWTLQQISTLNLVEIKACLHN